MYLNPPNADIESPPPRQEANDYVSLHLHQSYKKKQLRSRGTKRTGNTEIGTPSLSQFGSTRQGTWSRPSIASTRQHFNIQNDHDNDNGSYSTSNGPKTEEALSQSGRLRPVDTTVINSPTLSSPKRKDDNYDSPAAELLRRTTTMATNRRMSNQEDKKFISSPIVATFNALFGPKSTESPVDATNTSSGSSISSPCSKIETSQRGQSKQTTNGRDPAVKQKKHVGRGFETPASITLRKASKAFEAQGMANADRKLVSGGTQHGHKSISPFDDSSFNLAAIHSKYFDEVNDLNPLELSSSADRMSRLRVEFQPENAKQGVSSRGRAQSMVRIDPSTGTKRLSVVAETALTFADVQVAPGTFHSSPSSRKGSLFSPSPVSVVQVLSRSSIYEIVWQEDDNLSGWSSCSSTNTVQSPQTSEDLRTGLESNRSEGSFVGQDSRQAFQGDSVPVFMANDSKRKSFDWSWDLQEPALKRTYPGHEQKLKLITSMQSPSSIVQQPGNWSNTDVGYFPATSERKNISKLQQKLAIGMEDGRSEGRLETEELLRSPSIESDAEQAQSPTRLYRPEFDKACSRELRKSLYIGHPNAPARNLEGGNIGPHDKSTSQARRASVLHHPRAGIYRSRLARPNAPILKRHQSHREAATKSVAFEGGIDRRWSKSVDALSTPTTSLPPIMSPPAEVLDV